MRKIFFIIKVIFTIFIIILPAQISLPSEKINLKYSQNLSGSWEIAFTKDESTDSKKLKWHKITLPGNFIPLSIKTSHRAEGIAILRKKIFIPELKVKDGLGLYAGKIGNADKTYFNGTFTGSMGKFPPEDISMWNHSRFYIINSNLIKYNDYNLLTIKVAYSILGNMRGEPKLLDLSSWERKKTEANIMLILNYAVMSIMAAIGLIFLLIYIRRPDWKEYQYFLLQLIPGFFVVYESCGFVWPVYGDIISRIKIMGFMWTALVLFHLLFLHRLYNLKKKKTELSLWLIFILNTILIFFASDISRHQFIGLIVILLITPLAFYNISIHFNQLLKKHIYAKFLIIPGTVLSLTAAHDGLTFLPLFGGPDISLFGYSFQNIIFGYGAVMMFIGAAAILVSRFMNALDKIEDLNIHLEEKVKKRTEELEKSLNDLSNIIDNYYIEQKVNLTESDKITLSKSTEEKIKKAIIYINDNFTGDIAREGLAASLDINHDHLGKAFKIYTGKKIIDYINELRIKSTLIQLKKSDKKIIDIAFEAGFESLRTFNRAFIKIMHMTPSKYRDLEK